MQGVHVDLAFLVHQLGIHAFQRRQVEAILAAEVIVDHASVRAGTLGDILDTRVLEPACGELLFGGIENSPARCHCIATPDLLTGGAASRRVSWRARAVGPPASGLR